MARGACFVISQIGTENSEERVQADALLGVIENCCEFHDLDCVRADKIKGPTDINDDIIEYVRSADLCIVDLTNLNPNVMYEFGIRFETGRPFIVVAQKNTKLPFDIIARRTIFYDDLSLAAEARRVQKLIREYIVIFEEGDFRSLANIPSLSNIYGLLEKIDAKLDGIMIPTISSGPYNSNPVDMTNLEDLLSKLDPNEAFHYTYKTNQITLAEEILKLLNGTESFDLHFNKVCALAIRGSSYAGSELEKSINRVIESGEKQNIITAVGSLVSNYNHRDIESQKLDAMDNIFNSALNKMDTNRDRASILNQKQRLLAGAGEYETAKTIAETVITLNDEEAAYFFNYATILNHLGQIEPAIQQIKKALNLSDKDEDHLFFACQLLRKSSNQDHKKLYQECLTKLEAINPYKARLVRFQ